MLPQQNRLHLRKEKNFFSQAKRVSLHGVGLYWRKSQDNTLRAAVIVPAAVVRKATGRNLLKRIVSAVIQQKIIANATEIQGKEFIIIIHKVGETHDSLERTITHLLTEMRDRTR